MTVEADYSHLTLAVPLVQRTLTQEHQASGAKDFAIVAFICAMALLGAFFFMQVLALPIEIAASVVSLS